METGQIGAAHGGQETIDARKAVEPAVEEAEAQDQALIKLIRDELRSIPDAARLSSGAREVQLRRTLTAMTEDSPDTVLDDDELNALLERPFTELSVDELMAMKAAYEARGIRIYNSANIGSLVLAFLAGNVATPFVQALSQRAANSAVDMSKQVTDALREWAKRTGHPGSAPRVELPDNMTDEMWLALFDFVKTSELRGKVVRWDEKAMVWRAHNADD